MRWWTVEPAFSFEVAFGAEVGGDGIEARRPAAADAAGLPALRPANSKISYQNISNN